MRFKKFLESIVESKQLNESSDIKIKFHKKRDDLFGDANTILVDDSNFEIKHETLNIPIYPAVEDKEDEYAYESVYARLEIEYDIKGHYEPQTYDSSEDYEFEIKLNKVKVDEINTDDDYKELSDNFSKILKDKSNLEKIAKYIISDKEIEEFIEKTYFKEKERERDDY